jgi:uncharacterized membrane protein YfcA
MIAYALPGVAGAWLGLQVFQKMSDAQFQRLVNLALIVSGIALTRKSKRPAHTSASDAVDGSSTGT